METEKCIRCGKEFCFDDGSFHYKFCGDECFVKQIVDGGEGSNHE